MYSLEKDAVLSGRKVAVLVETEYIHDEIQKYYNFFTNLGAQVDFMTYLWGEEKRSVFCDKTKPDEDFYVLDVDKEIASCDPDDYDIILVAANYVACRLREIPPAGSIGSTDLLTAPPAVQFMIKAMKNKRIVKGALSHALWLLTPTPELLKGREVICHTVVLADIYNAGAVFKPDPSHIVVDDDLVTGRSATDLDEYRNAILETFLSIQENESNKQEDDHVK